MNVRLCAQFAELLVSHHVPQVCILRGGADAFSIAFSMMRLLRLPPSPSAPSPPPALASLHALEVPPGALLSAQSDYLSQLGVQSQLIPQLLHAFSLVHSASLIEFSS